MAARDEISPYRPSDVLCEWSELGRPVIMSAVDPPGGT